MPAWSVAAEGSDCGSNAWLCSPQTPSGLPYGNNVKLSPRGEWVNGSGARVWSRQDENARVLSRKNSDRRNGELAYQTAFMSFQQGRRTRSNKVERLQSGRWVKKITTPDGIELLVDAGKNVAVQGPDRKWHITNGNGEYASSSGRLSTAATMMAKASGPNPKVFFKTAKAAAKKRKAKITKVAKASKRVKALPAAEAVAMAAAKKAPGEEPAVEAAPAAASAEAAEGDALDPAKLAEAAAAPVPVNVAPAAAAAAPVVAAGAVSLPEKDSLKEKGGRGLASISAVPEVAAVSSPPAAPAAVVALAAPSGPAPEKAK